MRCLEKAAALCVEVLALSLLSLVGVSTLVAVAQTGWGWDMPFNRAGIDPAGGVKKIVKGLCRSYVTLLKAAGLAAVFCLTIGSVADRVLFDAVAESSQALALGRSMMLRVWCPALAALLVLGLTEYMLERRRFTAELSMSLDELRQEMKDDEGDPHVKASRRQMHRALAYEELVARVRASRVVIVER